MTKIEVIVVHHTATTTMNETVDIFLDPARQVSCHYNIDRDGSCAQMVRDDERAWHAGKSLFKGRERVNDFSIGIELVNRGDNKQPFLREQVQALLELTTCLLRMYGIPVENVVRHRDVAIPKGRKVDPARNFRWRRFKSALRLALEIQHIKREGSRASKSKLRRYERRLAKLMKCWPSLV